MYLVLRQKKQRFKDEFLSMSRLNILDQMHIIITQQQNNVNDKAIMKFIKRLTTTFTPAIEKSLYDQNVSAKVGFSLFWISPPSAFSLQCLHRTSSFRPRTASEFV
jgi:hypothetical protein